MPPALYQPSNRYPSRFDDPKPGTAARALLDHLRARVGHPVALRDLDLTPNQLKATYYTLTTLYGFEIRRLGSRSGSGARWVLAGRWRVGVYAEFALAPPEVTPEMVLAGIAAWDALVPDLDLTRETIIEVVFQAMLAARDATAPHPAPPPAAATTSPITSSTSSDLDALLAAD